MENQFHHPPEDIEFSSPFPVSHAQVDGKEAPFQVSRISFSPEAKEVVLFR
jgi:hypothetical protein